MAFNTVFTSLIISVWFSLLFCTSLSFALVSSQPYRPLFTFPVIDSLSVLNESRFTVDNEDYVELVFRMSGSNFNSAMTIRPTLQIGQFGQECSVPKNRHYDSSSDPSVLSSSPFVGRKFDILWANSTLSIMAVTFKPYINESKSVFYFCTTFDHERTSYNGTFTDDVIKWYHQGDKVALILSEIYGDDFIDSSNDVRRRKRDDNFPKDNPSASSDSLTSTAEPSAYDSGVTLFGFKVDYSSPEATYDNDDVYGIPELLVGSETVFSMFGHGWTNNSLFVLTEEEKNKGEDCESIVGEKRTLEFGFVNQRSTGHLKLTMPKPGSGRRSTTFYFCVKENRTHFVHLGAEKFLQIYVRERIIPIWSQIIIILFCLAFSCLFSGLNLGLLSLNQTDLKIISNTGTDLEKRYAKTIYPIRLDGNYLLCSILFGNVLVNSSFTILLDDMVSGTYAVIISTLAIVIFGEIVPQAVCSRHGLAIGAKTILVTKTVMILTMPLSWPISRALDWCLGQEITNIYTRERLKELVKVTREYNDLEKDEVNIISGALELRKKTVADVMTKIEDVYMLSLDTILDFETVSEIMKSGYSRIPIYENHRHNIVSLLYIKDLALIDPDDNTPLKTLSKFYQNSIYFVFEDITLDVVFKQFKEGCKGHMAFVNRVNSEGSGDPFYETIGIVTLEDVIEELIQAEIMDETDVYTDNRTKQRRAERNIRSHQDFSIFAERNENQRIHISPQLNLATYQFLTSSVDAFKPENISESVLLRLLKQDVIFHIKVNKDKAKDDPSTLIYQQGKPADYFALILEGRVEVIVGRENLVFESGPFTYFGSQALMQNIGVAESPTNASSQQLGSLQSVNIESMLRYTFIPDYTVHAVTQVFYLRIKRSIYLAAKKATLMERSKKVSNAGEQFDSEVEKILHSYAKSGSVEEDTKSQGSREGSYSNAQVSSFIEDSNRSTPLTQEVLNNGGISNTVSPTRTPRSSEQLTADEKLTLLGSNALSDDHRIS